jgi:fermentation-respiration switch protein FrsA (DUF1100 family)
MGTAGRNLVKLGAIAGAVLALVTAVFVARQIGMLDRQFIFFPERELTTTPAQVGLKYENVYFTANDGVELHGWWIPNEAETTMVWFHGNAGNISHRLDNLIRLHDRLKVNVFIFDYRGYGQSQGSPSEEGIYADAEAALDFVQSRGTRRLVLFGRSLGAAVAVEMATRHRVHAVILESPFTSVSGMARRAYPFLPAGLTTKIVRSRFNSISKIDRVDSPVLILHGDRDDIVPMDEGRELFEAANDPKQFYTIDGAGHNDTYYVGGERYFQALELFLEEPTGRPE